MSCENQWSEFNNYIKVISCPLCGSKKVKNFNNIHTNFKNYICLNCGEHFSVYEDKENEKTNKVF